MTKFNKKVTSLVLALAMLLTLGAPAMAVGEETTGENVQVSRSALDSLNELKSAINTSYEYKGETVQVKIADELLTDVDVVNIYESIRRDGIEDVIAKVKAEIYGDAESVTHIPTLQLSDMQSNVVRSGKIVM